MAALLALLAAAAFGIGDFLGGLASRKISTVTVLTMTSITGVVVALPLLAIVGGVWSGSAVLFGTLAGIFGAAGLGLLFFGLAIGPFQLVSPVSAVMGGAVPVIVGIASGDRPGAIAIAGLILTPPAIWILAGGTLTMPTVERRPLLAAIGAGVFIGLFLVCLAATPDEASFVPVFIAKVASSLVLIAWFLARSETAAVPFSRTIPKSTVALAVASGTADMSANGLFLAATRLGTLTTVGALVALYPAMSAVLAARVLGERLGRLQFLGFVLAITAGLLLAL